MSAGNASGLPLSPFRRHCAYMTPPPERSDRWTPPTRIILTALVALLSACRAPEDQRFASIHQGMSRQAVETALGPPSSSIVSDQADSPWRTRAHWGDTLSTLATHALMPDQPPPGRVWTVWFDEQDQVIKIEGPRADEGSLRQAPWQPPPRPSR